MHPAWWRSMGCEYMLISLVMQPTSDDDVGWRTRFLTPLGPAVPTPRVGRIRRDSRQVHREGATARTLGFVRRRGRVGGYIEEPGAYRGRSRGRLGGRQAGLLLVGRGAGTTVPGEGVGPADGRLLDRRNDGTNDRDPGADDESDDRLRQCPQVSQVKQGGTQPRGTQVPREEAPESLEAAAECGHPGRSGIRRCRRFMPHHLSAPAPGPQPRPPAAAYLTQEWSAPRRTDARTTAGLHAWAVVSVPVR